VIAVLIGLTDCSKFEKARTDSTETVPIGVVRETASLERRKPDAGIASVTGEDDFFPVRGNTVTDEPVWGKQMEYIEPHEGLSEEYADKRMVQVTAEKKELFAYEIADRIGNNMVDCDGRHYTVMQTDRSPWVSGYCVVVSDNNWLWTVTDIRSAAPIVLIGKDSRVYAVVGRQVLDITLPDAPAVYKDLEESPFYPDGEYQTHMPRDVEPPDVYVMDERILCVVQREFEDGVFPYYIVIETTDFSFEEYRDPGRAAFYGLSGYKAEAVKTENGWELHQSFGALTRIIDPFAPDGPAIIGLTGWPLEETDRYDSEIFSILGKWLLLQRNYNTRDFMYLNDEGNNVVLEVYKEDNGYKVEIKFPDRWKETDDSGTLSGHMLIADSYYGIYASFDDGRIGALSPGFEIIRPAPVTKSSLLYNGALEFCLGQNIWSFQRKEIIDEIIKKFE
jgi:hypothetical protein